MTDSQHTADVLHTVVVAISGTGVRVLVERLLGTPEQARVSAVETLLDLMNVRPLHWAVQVLRTEEITDVPDPTETN